LDIYGEEASDGRVLGGEGEGRGDRGADLGGPALRGLPGVAELHLEPAGEEPVSGEQAVVLALEEGVEGAGRHADAPEDVIDGELTVGMLGEEGRKRVEGAATLAVIEGRQGMAFDAWRLRRDVESGG
jgi:hypothetical protein